jgi:hypothetical protein
VRNGNGTIFEKSENAVTVDRIGQLVAIDPSGSRLVLETPVVDEPWLNIRFTPRTTGNYWIGLTTKPRRIRLTGSEFTEYLKHDGIPSVLSERLQKGISGRDEVEQYSKYVKAYLEVERASSATYDAPLGLEIEIIPLENPYSIAPGGILPVQVLFRGEPLSQLTLHAGFDGQSEESIHVLTDQEGKSQIPISKPGRWYIRGIHLFQVDQADHSYESYWATLTFQVNR